MSRRELKSLLAASKQISSSEDSRKYRVRGNIGNSMSEQGGEQLAEMEIRVNELEAEVENLKEQVSVKNSQLEEMESRLLHVKAVAETDSGNLRKQLEEAKVMSELEHLRAIEKVRQEYQVSPA